MEKQTEEKFWKECIHLWYPKLHSQTYFLPPLYFNRVPYSQVKVAEQTVYVPQDLEILRQSNPSDKSAIKQKTILESDVRDDQAQGLVLQSLRSLASEGQEVMMVVSQLQFGKYLRHPSYQAAASKLPVPFNLPKEYHRGDFDVLIIHNQYGIITGEIKSVGATFRRQAMSESEENVAMLKKVKDGIKGLNKSEVVLSHLVSDLEGVNITKTLMVPNITSEQLKRALNTDITIAKDLCQCLGVDDVKRAIELCYCADYVSKELNTWWQRNTNRKAQSMQKHIYETLIARFCGPATTVDVHCITSPRLELRTEGDAVSETGNRMARFVLFPEQIDVLTASTSHVFLSGPPGTGKTVMLILKALTWLQEGHDVHVVSTWRKSRAAAFLVEHQLQKTLENWKANDTKTLASKIIRHMYDLENVNEDDVKKAVADLSPAGYQSCIYITADEAGPEDDSHPFKQFCDLLLDAVQTVYLWAASLYRHVKPKCLTEIILTMSLRSPPVVTKEIEKAADIRAGDVIGYKPHGSITSITATDGLQVDQIRHSEGQAGHSGDLPDDCEQCGMEVARIVKDLCVSYRDKALESSSRISSLQYRDVFVLCKFPRDDIGLVRGIRQCGVPVRVTEYWADNDVIRDTALALHDVVTVTHWSCVHGLEKKVVFAMINSFQSHRLHGVSRCSAKLVVCNQSWTSDQTSVSSMMSYLIEYVRDWCPDLHKKTFFFPSRLPKRTLPSMKSQEGKSVVMQQTEEKKENMSVFNFGKTNSGADFRFQSDLVFHCLHAIADHSQDAMMFLSQLHFGQYTCKPSYTAAVTLFKDNNFRSQPHSDGEFDVLIIHSTYGLIIVEVESLKEGFAMLPRIIQDKNLIKKVKDAVKQLNKAEDVLRDLLADFQKVSIRKTLIMPKITSHRLLSALSKNHQLSQDLCQCLGVLDIQQAVELCLCKDMIPMNVRGLNQPSKVDKLLDWWKRTINRASKKILEARKYERLVALLCGSVATIRLCMPPFLLRGRKEGENINETGEGEIIAERGEIIVQFALTPDQISILNTFAPRVYLVGPPRTGKTVTLVVKAIQWLQKGHDVHVVSTCTGSRAALYLIWHQLQKSLELWSSEKSSGKAPSVHLNKFILTDYDSIRTAINYLIENNCRSELHIISEESLSDSSESSITCMLQFCEMLSRAVPELFMWMLAVNKSMTPSCFQEVTLTRSLRLPSSILSSLNTTVKSDVIIIEHFESGHNNVLPDDCEQCGQEVATILSGSPIGPIGPKENSGTAGQAYKLNYSDVLVLCDDPHDDRVDNRGNVISPANGFVKGLREHGLPVYVMERFDDPVSSNMERADFEKVTVTCELCALYLQWKVVVNVSAQLERHESITRGTSRNTLHIIKYSEQTIRVTNNLQWYPEFHQRSYFVPPLHINRVAYNRELVSGQSVLVPEWKRNSDLFKPHSVHSVNPIKCSLHMNSGIPSKAQNVPRIPVASCRVSTIAQCLKYFNSMNSSYPESECASPKISSTIMRTLVSMSRRVLYNPTHQNVRNTDIIQPTRVLDYTLKPKTSARDSSGEKRPRTPSLRVQPTQVFSHDRRVGSTRQFTLQISSSSASFQPNQRKSCQLKHLPIVFDHDVREDKAQRRVLRGLRTLTEKLNAPMFVISQLSLDSLGESIFNTDIFWLPRLIDLDAQYRHNKSDLLIIHSKYGLMNCEIISEGDNFSHQMGKREENSIVARAIETAVKRLNKLSSKLNNMLSDMQEVKNMTIIMAPCLTSKQLLRAVNSHPQVGQSLMNCLGVESDNDAVQHCLCEDQLSSLDTCEELPDTVFEELHKWWEQISCRNKELPQISPQTYRLLVSRFRNYRTTGVSPRIEMKTQGEMVAEAGIRMTQLILYQYQVNIVNKLTPRVLLSGPPGTGKRTMLYLKGLQWLRAGHDVHIVSTNPDRRVVSFLLEYSLSKTELAESRSPKPSVERHDFNFEEDDRDFATTLSQLETISKSAPLCIISDEVRFGDNFEAFCKQLLSRVPGVFMWAASLSTHNIPDWLIEEVTIALRLPPVVLQQVQRSEVLGGDIAKYKLADVPAPTDGPVIKRMPHSNAPGHSQGGFEDCEWCGHGISLVLRELHVNITDRGSNIKSRRLKYNDVVVLCHNPRDNSQGHETSEKSGLVRGLRDCHIPVHVIEKNARGADIRDMALAVRNKVTVAHWEKVIGLERKVVVMKECSGYENLLCASCCTSMLVIID